VAGLLIAALGLAQVRLGFPLIRALPDTAQVARAEAAAARGFVPGILSPTEVLVLGPGVTRQRAALTRLQHALAAKPGAAGVVGPADIPAGQQGAHLLLARSGGAARYGVIERTDPLGATAIGRVRELRRELPALARTAGLTGVRVEVGGETALAGEAIDAAVSDLGRIALAIGLVIVILLGGFLRALVAPFYLLGASMLALLAALGLTVWIFQDALGYDSLVYYVPFVVAVLLISLGSDYNVFVVGRIWEEARRRPLRDAVAVAAPRASRAITTAGLALAAGFGVLALVPLDQFREIAAAMALGIVIDTFVVRSLLVPALVVLFGRVGTWPARLVRREPGQARPADRAAVP
jgi:RND superfamily putative drug exporter